MKPLEGVRVIDLTTYLAAPTTVRVLGEWGADCIKIESMKGDPARGQGAVFNMPFTDEENLAFDYANFNKRFITLDLKSEQGLEVAYKLLATADVFVTNTRTKSLERLGLDYETLQKKFPRLIFAQVLGYGEKGPEKDSAGFDVTCYMARGGVFGTTLNRGDAPMIPTNGFGDFQVSMCLASGIATALYAREKTGKGDKVTVGLHHAAAFMLSTGVISAQYGNQYPKSRKEVPNPFNNVFQTKDDKWVVICCPEYDRDYEKIMTLLHCEHMIGDSRYTSCAKVNENKLNHEVTDILDEAIKKFTRQELMDLFKSHDLPCEAAYEPLDMYEDEQVWANDVMVKIPYPSGERNVSTNPVKFQSLGLPEYRIGGAEGQHTVSLLKELGYSDTEVEELLSKGYARGECKLRKKA